MATAYHRDQAGAPALAYNGSIGGVSHFTALKTILKACLVTGYGSKAAAGWELIAEGTNYLVLRNGSHSGYICFTWAPNYIRIFLAETYTGVVNDVMTGDGLKTGFSANNAAPQSFYAAHLANFSASTTWYMVADAKTFILQIACSSSSAVAEVLGLSATSFCPAVYAGEDSAGNFISIGGLNSGGITGEAYFYGGGGTAIKNPNTGLLIGAGSLDVVTPGLEALDASGSRVIALSSVQLSPAIWAATGIQAGRLRGVALSPFLSRVYSSHAAQALGFVGALTTRNANTPIGLSDGYTYFAGVGYKLSSFKLYTDNPEFW